MPGWFVVAFLDVGSRLAFGESPLVSQGAVAEFLNVLESPLWALGIALVAGLLLYAIDVPARTYLMRVGDPAAGKGLPSRHLGEMLSSEALREREMSVYFLLLDRYMHPETHRRIYLFGSLFRVFVDLRILAGFFFVLSLVAGLLAGSGDIRLTALSEELATWTTLTMALWVAAYFYGFGQHAMNSARKHRTGIKDFLERHGPEILKIWPIALLLVAVNMFSVAMALSGLQVLVTVVGSALGFGLWLRLEIGPPPGLGYWPGVWWRAVQFTGVKVDNGLSAHQRAVVDLAEFGPWLLAAPFLVHALGREASWVSAWLVFLVPIGLVLGFHKHEDRLRNTYGDQITWLDLHSDEIRRLDERGQLPSDWS